MSKLKSRWHTFDSEIDELLKSKRTDWSPMAREMLDIWGIDKPSKKEIKSLSVYIMRRAHKLTPDVIFKEPTPEDPQETPEELVISAWKADGSGVMDIDEYCEYYGFPREDVVSYKLVTHVGTPYYNTQFKEKVILEPEDYKQALENVLNNLKIAPDKKFIAPLKSNSKEFTRLIYTDTHIGMDTNKHKINLYATPWNAKEALLSMRRMVDEVLKFKQGDVLYIDELGDMVDGYNEQTVRGGHSLPQNMTNIEAFECAVTFKLEMIKLLAPHFAQIVCHNVCNDNHAGDFGAMVNSSFKRTAEVMWKNVEVINILPFMGHYIVGKHAFVLCHGKDKEHKKFGFTPQIKPIHIEHIDHYLKFHRIYGKAEYIEFSKGDSHQLLFDYSSAQDFDYCNYLALGPASEWISTNYKRGSRGFTMQTGNLDERELTVKTVYL